MARVSKHYDEKYFKERDHLDVHIGESLKIFTQDNNLKKILDVGCGTGRLVKFLNEQGYKTIGCDPMDSAVIAAQKINKNSKVIVKASAIKLPFKNSAFDLITCISTIEHLTESEGTRFIKEAKRVLTPGGFVFLITPNFNSPLRYILGKKWFGYSDPTHLHFYTPESLSGLLFRHGFADIRLRFKTANNLDFDWHIPGFLRPMPMPIKNLMNWLMISSPLSTFRDSFWIAAQKLEENEASKQN